MAAAFAAQAGVQTALMVPTEILSEQHFQTALRRLEPLGVRVALLTGQVKAKEREEVLSGLKSGEIHVAIGTHA